MMHRILPLLLPGLLLAACREPAPAEADVSGTAPASAVEAPPPLANVANAYEAAGATKLAETEPQEFPGLHNVYRLSDNIVSGSEPEGEEALRKIAEMGVKTILSVDGKTPDQATAAKYGIRYVHVPIHYSGITPDELDRIAKTFRELEGPFYVHCFHGKHRGPAGAAVGRLVLDGTPREQALAEMRQWCGTSEKYEGLYRTIATQDMPSASETGKYDWDFPAAHPFQGFRQAMIGVTRSFDFLDGLGKRNWEADPEHPDVDAVNEAEKLADLFGRSVDLDEVKAKAEDFREWTADAATQSAQLLADLREHAEGAEGSAERAAKSLRVLKQTCTSCHAAYRDK